MGLYEKNHPKQFWKLIEPIFTDDDWLSACRSAIHHLEDLLPQKSLCDDLIYNVLQCTLGEEQFGLNHWKLSFARRFFYHVKPIIPQKIQRMLDKIYRSNQKIDKGLRFPIEERYVMFQFELLKALMQANGCLQIPYIHFWAEGKRFAFILTHDVETKAGFKAISDIAELEEQYGFRSIFNIVPERYPVDKSYLEALRSRGFEIGIHGLKHDGKLFKTHKEFNCRAKKINNYLSIYGATGFRTPLMHRQPVWMQALNCDYDMSFFDTDPYEGMPGGCMSIWPFFMGHFVELPYTLIQDHTLMMILEENTPKLWMDKVNFIGWLC
jgi:hypothetical protein